MNSENVLKALEAAKAKAEELKIAVTVAVVDNSGILLGLLRMDGAISISPRFAVAKAYTSGTIGLATADMAGYATEGKPYFGITSILGGELTTIAGGVPVMIAGKLAGGVGVGGSTDVNQDAECAKAAMEVLQG